MELYTENQCGVKSSSRVITDGWNTYTSRL